MFRDQEEAGVNKTENCSLMDLLCVNLSQVENWHQKAMDTCSITHQVLDAGNYVYYFP